MEETGQRDKYGEAWGVHVRVVGKNVLSRLASAAQRECLLERHRDKGHWRVDNLAFEHHLKGGSKGGGGQRQMVPASRESRVQISRILGG